MTWERIWGATKFVVVDGETGAVYAKPAASTGLTVGIYRWDGTPFGWAELGGNMVEYVAAGWAPHSCLYGIDGQGVVHRHDQNTGSWISIGGPSNGKAKKIFGGPDQLLAIATQGSPDLFRWDALTTTWERIGGPAKKVVVGKSSDIEFRLQVYGQSPDDASSEGKGVYQWRGGWYKEGGPAGDIFVSQSQLFATNPASGDLLMKSPSGWKRIGGPGQQFATDHRGHVYGLSPGGEAVFRWTGIPNQWEQIGNAASAIFAGWDGQLFAINPTTSDLWHYRSSCPAVGAMPAFHGVIRTEKMKNVLGARKVIVVLWDPHRPIHPRPTREQVESTIFGPKPSLQHWIEENSGGRATLMNAGIFGWYDAPASKQGEHYWDNYDPNSPDPAKHSPTYHADKYQDGWLSGHVEKWADAIRRAAQDTNLAVHDTNGDGTLTTDEVGFFLCYPQNGSTGYGRKTAGQQHPTVLPLVVDGVNVPWILEWYLGAPPHFGVGSHELAHLVLNTPDMYFDIHWPFAAGGYSVSDQANGQHLSAPEKLKLGWLDYMVVTQDGTYALTDVETTSKALIVMSPKRGGDEYFLLENRWRGTSYDAGGSDIGSGIPADGLAIWHVIEDPALFNAVISGCLDQWGRTGIRMIRANGGVTFDDKKALFSTPGAVISDVTNPANLRWLDDKPSGIRIKLMTGPGPTIQLEIGVSCP
jgi:M6 family metalloprotease-like protein